jgi:hypothetical protein
VGSVDFGYLIDYGEKINVETPITTITTIEVVIQIFFIVFILHSIINISKKSLLRFIEY